MRITTEFYFISSAARLLGMHPQTLRKYERLGLVQPTRTVGSMRVYTGEELERLRLIKHLVDELGINLAGVQRLLSVAESVERMRKLSEAGRTARTDGRRATGARDRAAVRHHRPRPRRRGLARTGDAHGIQGLLPDARRRQDGLRQGDQAGLPEAGPQVPPGREPGRQGGRVALQGDQRGLRGARRSREAEEVRRTGRELAPVRTGAAGRPVAVRRLRWGGGPGEAGGYRTINEEELRDMFGGENPFSDFFQAFFGGGGRPEGRRARTSRATRAQSGPRHRGGDRAVARRGDAGRDAAPLRQAGGAHAHGGRAHPGRRQRRLARARARRRRTRGVRRTRRRPLPADSAARRPAVRAARTRPPHAGRRPGDDGGPRR